MTTPTVYPTAAAADRAAAPRACIWCQRPATDLVVELDEQVPACEDCTWAHENEPSDQDAHDHYQDVSDRNARLLITFNR